LTGKICQWLKGRVHAAAGTRMVRTIQEDCKPLPTVARLIYSFRTVAAPVFLLLMVRASDLCRCRRLAAKPNADEHSSPPPSGRWSL
jgi:hypothetical protein